MGKPLGGAGKGSPYRFPAHRDFITKFHLATLTADGFAATGLVWFVLWDWANDKDGTIRHATVMAICKVTGLARNTVKDALKRLLKAKYVSKPKELQRPGGMPVYRLNATFKTLANPKPPKPKVKKKATGGMVNG